MIPALLVPAVALATAPLPGQVAPYDARIVSPEVRAYVAALESDPTDEYVPGFTSWFSSSLDRAVEVELADGAAPGAAVVVGHRGRVVLARGYGRTDRDPDARPVTTATLYDLASVTKLAATTVAAMILVQEGQLDLDAPVSAYLDGWPTEGLRAATTVRHLLTHTAALPAGAAFWRVEGGRSAWVGSIGKLLPEWPPGERELYSDVGPILMGFVVEAVSGEPLDSFVERRVYRPLGMTRTLFRPAARGVPVEEIAPTEVVGDALLRGIVHDPSARAIGGVAGNAGLFASADDLATLASALLWETPAPVVCRDVLRMFTASDAGRRFGAGFDTPSRRTFWSQVFSEDAFGHTGFTGTSLWIDPRNDLFVVLLTNRVNPSSDEGHIALRRAVHGVVRRGHLDDESTDRAADWRWVDTWSGADHCRAERGVEALQALGNRLLIGVAR